VPGNSTKFFAHARLTCPRRLEKMHLLYVG
jgi:hypothetical protein